MGEKESASVEPRVAVIVLTLNGMQNLDVCLSSLLRQTYSNYSIFFHDQASVDGSFDYVKKHFLSVKAFRFDKNIGYAKGNNIAMKNAFAGGADFCLLINDDTESEPDLLAELVSTYTRASRKSKTGLIQPTILLFEERDKVNTIGNAIHYLGYGYCKDLRKPYVKRSSDRPISSASGAALLVSKKYYEDIGGFDEDFFMYNEDQNYSWKGLLRGYTHFVSTKAVLYHKYSFRRNKNKIFNSEKNRIMIVWENYAVPTLFLLFPVFFFGEVVSLGYSLASGYFVDKIRSYGYLIFHLGDVRKARKIVQKKRIVSDKEVIKQFESELVFEELKHPVLTYIVNPIFKAYYSLLMTLL